MQHTHRAADTVSTVKFLNLTLTPRYVSIYNPISKININIIHHGIHSDNFYGGVTISCDNKLLFITFNGKFQQLHFYRNIYLLLLLFKIKDWVRESNFHISGILKLILPHSCLFSRIFYTWRFCKLVNFGGPYIICHMTVSSAI